MIRLKKHTESTGNGTTKGRWFTIFVGSNGERFSLYSSLQMPDHVEVNWAPPVTNKGREES